MIGNRPVVSPKIKEPNCFLSGPINLSGKKHIKIIRRDNRGALALYLPNVAVYNHRSIWQKFNNFVTEAKETQQMLTFHSEVWEVKEKKKHQKKLEEMLELHGITYISTPRPGRRGGGCAITSRTFYYKGSHC